MPDATKTIFLVGGLGVGGYLIYEYMQYSNAVNTIAAQGGGTPNSATVASIQQALPFFTYIQMNFGMAASSTNTAIAYALIKAVASGATYSQALASVQGSTQAPGTTSSGQATSVSSAPGTTSPAPPAPQPTSSLVPAKGIRGGALALQMQNTIGMSIANADQWNYAYTQINGEGVDRQFGLNFDAVYGPVVNGTRSSGTMTANVFLQKAQTAISGGTSGVGRLSAIAQYAGPALATQGNLIYQAHHPFPYTPTYTLRGLGAVTAPTGFESALFARRPLRSNRIR